MKLALSLVPEVMLRENVVQSLWGAEANVEPVVIGGQSKLRTWG
jgi:hypothetical protein